MENLDFLNPVTIYQSIVDGTLVDKVDKRLVSGLIAYVGLKLAYSYIMKPTYTFYRYCIRPAKDLHKRYTGGWAVVTGASDGIGLGFCKNLAKLGFNVMMISRNLKKLQEKAEEVKKLNDKVEVKVLEFNFNRPYKANEYKVIYDELDKIDVSLLVNNVGYGYLGDGINYYKMADHNIVSLYQINLTPMIFMTKYFLNRALKREGKKSGIINVSSIASLFPLPDNHIYTGSKAFIDNFTKSLAATPQYKDIDFLVLNTASVESNMNRGKILFSVKPDDYTKQALTILGNEVQDHGHLKHHICASMLYNPITLTILLIDIYNKMDSLGGLEDQKPVGS